jgi:uncharacterized Zn-binding protein involved in type VI secretion
VSAEAAARMGDEIAHGFGLAAMIAGAVAGAVVGAAIVAATAATGGLAAVIIAGAVAGGGLAAGQIMSGLTTIFNLPEPTSGVVATGSPNVLTNMRPAVRALLDVAGCTGIPMNHPPLPMPVPLVEGAATVLINNMPASRLKSKLMCGAQMKSGSNNVIIGGETARVGFVFDLEAWFKTGLEVLGLAALIGGGLFAAAAGLAAFGGFAAMLVGGAAVFEGVGQIGDALGPGYRDLLQGVAGMGLLLAGPRMARKTPAGKVVADREQITALSKAGKIDEARAVLQPHVDARNPRAIVDRLDVSTEPGKGYLWSGNKTAAGEYAANRGGTTLEQTPGGRVIDDWPDLNTKLPWDKGGEELWGGVSSKYAEGLSGDVVAVQSPAKAGGGYVFKNYELPKIEEGLVSGRITGFEERIVLPNESPGP